MRIISPFKDYYDGMAAYDDGYNLIYRRINKTPTLISLPFRLPYYCYSYYNHTYRRIGHWIGFAGTVYPMLEVYKDGKLKYIYDMEIARKEIRTSWDYDKYEAFLNPKNVVDIFDKHGPTWIISGQPYKYPIVIIENPRLLDFKFQEVLPAHIAYNELNKFMCNRENPTKPVPEMSNDIKIEQHGFDLKTSFRKSKENK